MSSRFFFNNCNCLLFQFQAFHINEQHLKSIVFPAILSSLPLLQVVTIVFEKSNFKSWANQIEHRQLGQREVPLRPQNYHQ